MEGIPLPYTSMVVVVGGDGLTRKAKPEEVTVDVCIKVSVFDEGDSPNSLVLYHGNMIVQSFCAHVCIFLLAISMGYRRTI